MGVFVIKNKETAEIVKTILYSVALIAGIAALIIMLSS